MTLLELLDRVNDEASFLEFALALAQDREAAVALETKSPSNPFGQDAGGWESTSIENFLDAAVAWAKDSRFGASNGVTGQNPWKKFAEFLYAGKIYE